VQQKNEMIKLDRNATTSLINLRGKGVLAKGLQVVGSGTLFVCLLEFYNEGESAWQHQELFFHLPVYKSSKLLPPRQKDFNIGRFDYCKVKILTGSLHPEDEILLSYQSAGKKKPD
jgi:hypothetical protein